jgi:S1-C subfamily serine protease
MKQLGGAILAVASMAAITAAALAGFSNRVDLLQARLDASDADLLAANREIAQLQEDLPGRMEARLASRIQKVETLARNEALGIVRALAQDVEALYRDVLYPSVQVSGAGGVGGGTLLYSRASRSYVISAYHVVQKAPAKKDAPPPDNAIEVKLYDVRGSPVETVEANLVAFDEKKDLALLRLHSDRTWPNVARMASRETMQEIKVFTPVYAVGCPLGHDPLPTLGEVATLHKEVGGERFWMMNAPTIFGNSGGGIFHRDTREMIGVSAMICTYDGVVSTPVPHLGILVSLETVYDWLDSLGCRFLYDPEAVPETCGTGDEKPETSALPHALRRFPSARISW